MVELERALRALYTLVEEAEQLGLSRAARLRIVAIIGDLEAAGLRKGDGAGPSGDSAVPRERPQD